MAAKLEWIENGKKYEVVGIRIILDPPTAYLKLDNGFMKDITTFFNLKKL
jgi:hypothetical protein